MLSALLSLLSLNEIAASTWKEDSKIVGGQPLLGAEKIPFIISVQTTDEGHNCGGSLISPNYVLTACHCLADTDSDPEIVEPYQVESYIFVAGLVKLTNSVHAQKRTAKKFHIHPGCGKTPKVIMVHDFAIGEMQEPFVINEFVQPFKLLSDNPEVFLRKMKRLMGDPDSVCLVAGWGSTERGFIKNPVASDVLNVVRMFVISESKCQRFYGARNPKFAEFPFLKFNQMCTISRESNASDCQGDSGGPYFCGEYVVGVVSYGFECGSPMPNVYTSLPDFLKWFTTKVRGSTRRKDITNMHSSENQSTTGTSRGEEVEAIGPQPRRMSGSYSWNSGHNLMFFTFLLAVSCPAHFQ